MPFFHYVAATENGRTQRGKIEAASAQAATQALRAQRLLPVELRAAGPKVTFSLPARKSLSSRELAALTRQMATLLESSVRIEDALTAVAYQSGARTARIVRSLHENILQGQSVAAALEQHSKSFDTFYTSSVRAGERAGRLGAVMAHLADHVETRSKNQGSVQLALIYPAILALVSLAVVTALLVFVVPDIVRVFASRGAELPGLTRGLIALSEGIQVWWPWIALTLAAASVTVWQMMRLPKFRMEWHRFLLKTQLNRQIAATQFAGTLATLTQSGVTLNDALEAASGTVGNIAYRDIVREVANAVRDGAALSQAMAGHRVFSAMMITMVASGEAGGTLPRTLSRYADDSAQSLNAIVKALMGLVEPLVLLVMGGIVMLLVLAILLPIVNLNNLVG
ncbi:type II secretion system F family protein [uncultured Roseobacter sp.]|uniref:type II secretion system F family protein n=1 Tax=uncultured Roseobacter sp. TaxID=114847 RepID=UPI00262312E7|nr:type II secretion system F family protein [uncultured Roseobacter sp.]